MDSIDPPSDEQYQASLDRIERLVSEFGNSQQFEQLTEHQQREAQFVIETFHELLYGYEYVPLDDPDEQRLEAVCRQLYPAKISADSDHFETVAPVIGAFLRFLDVRGDIENGTQLASHVESLGDTIVDAAADPANWGMAKSMFMSGDLDDATQLDTGSDAAAPSELFETPLDSPEWESAESLNPDEFLPSAETDRLEEIINSLSPESDAVLASLTAATDGLQGEIDPDVALERAGVSLEEYDAVIEEIVTRMEAEGSELISSPGDTDDPSVLDPDAAREFLELKGRLLLYVNDRFGVVPGIDTYEEFQQSYIDELRPIHDTLYRDTNVAEVIEEFIRENPADFSPSQLEQIESWLNYEAGQFFVVEHLDDGTVFLDPDEPQAYKVTGVYDSYAETLPEDALPVAVTSVVLLPYEGRIVTDGLEEVDMLAGMAMQMIKDDPETAYEEAKHRFGIAETLPPEDEPARSDAERLRFYTKNQDNRERFADEIEALKDKTEELARIYHEQLGKASARRLGRKFRDLGLEAAYVAIYDGQVVATAPTEAQLEEMLSAIMPDGKDDHPYVYHYDP
ncbi:hypothetical protein [Halococcus sp. PRR34]|uniref:hypothetical protein n=1 Tax=Halococcus sp. PRR34 TaxID=3020830 RepID=UPI0023610D0C|nr:hypothetical protein [Halococcus sp. PRR34]